MRTAVRVVLSLVLLISVGLVACDVAVYYLYSPWTRDGRFRADVVTVSPDVSGYVTDLRVRSNQFVKKGDILVVIDQERYRLALANAEATVAARLAQYRMLQQQLERRSRLTLNLSITQEDLDNVRRQTESANAGYQQSQAERDLAALNLKRTEVRATVNGYVTNLNLEVGDYEFAGQGDVRAHRQRLLLCGRLFRGDQDPADPDRIICHHSAHERCAGATRKR